MIVVLFLKFIRLKMYKSMWLFVMFDLDFGDKFKVKEYTKFRKFVLGEGFVMMQYSIYIKCFPSQAELALYKNRIKKRIPCSGQVRFLGVTGRQFANMEILTHKKQQIPEEPQKQLWLF